MMADGRLGSRRVRAVVVLGGVAVAAGLMALVVWGVRVDSPLASSAPALPVVVPVQNGTSADSVPVTLTVVPAPTADVVANRSGIVTGVPVAAGDTVAGGDVLVSVLDEPVVAFTGAAPLYRDLSPGAQGGDVRRLQAFLVSLGLLDGEESGQFDAATAEAVARFNRDAGLGGDAATLRLADVAWIGPGPAPVVEVAAVVGAPLDPGSVLMTRSTGGVTVEVSEPDAAGGEEPAGGSVLSVGDVSVPYVPGSGRVEDPDDAAAVAAALPGGDGAGWVAPADPVPVLTVPASAVVTDPDGSVCVFPDVDADPLVVEPVGGGIGTVDLPADTDLATVLVNPGEVLDDPRCS